MRIPARGPLHRLLALLLAVLLLAACATRPPAAAGPPVLLVSIDGFRAADLDHAPTLRALADHGVRAVGMLPSYPSLTFPNHYTMVTGLRPDRHGIVHNTMRDPVLGRFSISDRNAVGDGRWWAQGVPIWVTAHKAGLRTATMFWPGSEAQIDGVRPDTWHAFDAALPPAARVDVVLGWLDRAAAEQPRLMTLYFDQVDHAGHDAGPDAAETRQAIAQVDAALARLVHGLRRRGLLDRLNLVVVSDHGMAAVAADHLVAIEDMVSGEEATVTSLGQVVGIDPAPGSRAQVEAKLLGAHPQYDCWRKSELPERWHYGTHPRVPSIVCQMREGWQAVNASWKARGSSGTRGAHGFDPALPSMHALFVAHGPAFRAGTVLPLFDNVDVYPLLAQLLGIEPAANDGELTPLRPALQQP